MTPVISIIVAVYKAESCLRRCVDSLLAQTFQDYEILLVDDGSPDRSGEICDEYARKDNRVRVFHKEEKADMIICDVWRDTSKKSTYVKQRLFILEHCVMLKDVFQQLHGSCCNKLV